jgi:molybdenum cofactor cytidylyltransferase
MERDRSPRLAGVVLAAGYSRRAGVFKPAFEHDGKSLLLHAVDGLGPWCEAVVVVGGERADEVAGLVARCPGAVTVVNDRPQDGMFSSVQIGAGALAEGLDGFFVLPADCPLVSAETYAALIAAFVAREGTQVLVPEFGGRGGHPVLLPASALSVVLAAPVTMTLREVLRDQHALRVAVDDDAVLMDLDTAEDLRALSARGEG